MEVPGLFAVELNRGLLHQTIVADQAAKWQGTAHTKSRGEVAGSTRKLYRQKGTGRARVGDRRSPTRVGGGTVMGPRAHSHRQTLPAKMKAEALREALAARAAAGEMIVIEAIELAEAKTRLMQGLLDIIGVSGDLLLVLADHNEAVWRSGRNIKGLSIIAAVNLSAYEVATARKILLEKGAIARLEERLL
jgi:large subunit ribosomal protein L4